MQKIQNIINTLRQSPLFNLSLASKELFHSNFLAWIIEERGDIARTLLQNIAPEVDSPVLDESLKVMREENNFDLTVLVTSSKGQKFRIVIENKVKSVPTKKQLDEYSAKLVKEPKDINKTIKILLSLSEPSFPDKDGRYHGWEYISYDILRDSLPAGKIENPYHAALVTDYHGFIQNLIDLRNSIHEEFNNDPKSLINPFDQPGVNVESLYTRLKKIRMHDIFEKWRMIAIENEIKKGISEQAYDNLIFLPGFTRGIGLLDISPKKKDQQNSFFKIQLQGRQLRQVLEKYNAKGEEVFKQAKHLLEKGQWFKDSDGNQLKTCGKKVNHNFCKYGDSFVYRHEPLNDFSRILTLASELSKKQSPGEVLVM